MLKPIAIFGAGGFGKEVLMLIHQINEYSHTWDFIGFFDDGKPINTYINNYKVLGGLKELNEYTSEVHLIFAIGNPATKIHVLQNITNPRIKFPILIHPPVK